MFRKQPGVMILAAALILALAGLWVASAPLMPRRAVAPDDVRSLSGIKKLRLRVGTMPPQLHEAGLDDKEIAGQWRRALIEAGFEVVDDDADPATPILELSILGGGDKGVPGGLAFSSTVLLWQPMHLERTNETLHVPTYHRVVAGMEPKETMIETAKNVLNAQVQGFIGDVRIASLNAEPGQTEDDQS